MSSAREVSEGILMSMAVSRGTEWLFVLRWGRPPLPGRHWRREEFSVSALEKLGHVIKSRPPPQLSAARSAVIDIDGVTCWLLHLLNMRLCCGPVTTVTLQTLLYAKR